MEKPKKKKKGVKYWKAKAWKEFSIFIRRRDALATTGTKENVVCCSCGKTYPAFGVGCAQAGHFVPGRANAILFDERGVNAQGYVCNVTLKGNWPGYMDFMLKKYGRGVVDELLHKNKEVLKYTPADLEDIYNHYKELNRS